MAPQHQQTAQQLAYEDHYILSNPTNNDIAMGNSASKLGVGTDSKPPLLANPRFSNHDVASGHQISSAGHIRQRNHQANQLSSLAPNYDHSNND